jgi:hypothetical protein
MWYIGQACLMAGMAVVVIAFWVATPGDKPLPPVSYGETR